uniref:Uncharacterized protein n=1 Tax=Arundo donax TaxID=35708 RepID=A0A0A9HVX8_ARUDO
MMDSICTWRYQTSSLPHLYVAS